MTDFGIRLRHAMQAKDMNASDLSKASGISKSLISYYLRGTYLAKQDKVYLLAKALDVDPGWLMTGYEPSLREIFDTIDDELEDVPQTPEARILAKGIDKLSPEERAQALAVVKAMFAKHPEIFNE